MAVKPIQTGTPPAGSFLTDVLKELQNLKVTVVAGTTADTDIAVAGLAYQAADITDGSADHIVAIIVEDDTTGVIASNLVAEAQAGSAAANIQLSTTDTTNKTLIIVWMDKP